LPRIFGCFQSFLQSENEDEFSENLKKIIIDCIDYRIYKFKYGIQTFGGYKIYKKGKKLNYTVEMCEYAREQLQHLDRMPTEAEIFQIISGHEIFGDILRLLE
jgi:hypothetical protein